MAVYEIDVAYIHKGMVVATHIYSKTGALLLSEGSKLDEKVIQLLTKAGLKSIKIYDENIDNQVTFPNAGYNESKYKYIPKKSNTPHNLIKNEIELLIGSSSSEYASSEIRKTNAYVKIGVIFRDLLNKHYFLDYLLNVKSIDRFTLRHSINVAVISLLVATSLNLKNDDLNIIALGAVFHDIGKERIHHDLLFSNSQWNSEEKNEMGKHTIYGYDILSSLKHIPDKSALIALQHHERINGSGYPYQLKNEEIDLFSQIVGIADVYEAMTCEVSYRKSYSPAEVVEYLMAGSLFKKEVIKAFLKAVSVRRIGSMVQLSTGEYGIVIQSNFNPTRPIVMIVFDRDKKRVEKPFAVDLSAQEYTTTYIAKSFG